MTILDLCAYLGLAGVGMATLNMVLGLLIALRYSPVRLLARDVTESVANIYANVDHRRASFRTCASSRYPALGGTPFLFS
jgi:hypothetical protein